MKWSLDLANKLLKEAPLDMPLIEVFALALETERERAASMARSILEISYKYEDMQQVAHDTAEEIAAMIEAQE